MTLQWRACGAAAAACGCLLGSSPCAAGPVVLAVDASTSPVNTLVLANPQNPAEWLSFATSFFEAGHVGTAIDNVLDRQTWSMFANLGQQAQAGNATPTADPPTPEQIEAAIREAQRKVQAEIDAELARLMKEVLEEVTRRALEDSLKIEIVDTVIVEPEPPVLVRKIELGTFPKPLKPKTKSSGAIRPVPNGVAFTLDSPVSLDDEDDNTTVLQLSSLTLSVRAVPEPSSITLTLAALALLAARSRPPWRRPATTHSGAAASVAA